MYKLSEPSTWEAHLNDQLLVHNENVRAANPGRSGFDWKAVRELRPSNGPVMMGFEIVLQTGKMWLTIQEFPNRDEAVEDFKSKMLSTSSVVLEPFNAGLPPIGDLAFVDRGLNPNGMNRAIVVVRGNLVLSLQALGSRDLDIGSAMFSIDGFFGLPPQESRKNDERIGISLSDKRYDEEGLIEVEILSNPTIREEAWIRVFTKGGKIGKKDGQIFLYGDEEEKANVDAYIQLGAGIPMKIKLA